MKEQDEILTGLTDEETALHGQFESWLRKTGSPFDEW